MTFLGTALFELLILLLVRPPRILVGLFSKRAGNRLKRIEDWMLHQTHALGVEQQTVWELEKRAQATMTMESGTFTGGDNLPSLKGDATKLARRHAGAPLEASPDQTAHDQDLESGPRQVEGREGQTRSEEMQEALLRAQREERARLERQGRRRP